MCLTQVICPRCGSENISNSGYSDNNVPRYRCRTDECETKTFMLEYRYKAYEPFFMICLLIVFFLQYFIGLMWQIAMAVLIRSRVENKISRSYWFPLFPIEIK